MVFGSSLPFASLAVVDRLVLSSLENQHLTIFKMITKE